MRGLLMERVCDFLYAVDWLWFIQYSVLFVLQLSSTLSCTTCDAVLFSRSMELKMKIVTNTDG